MISLEDTSPEVGIKYFLVRNIESFYFRSVYMISYMSVWDKCSPFYRTNRVSPSHEVVLFSKVFELSVFLYGENL